MNRLSVATFALAASMAFPAYAQDISAGSRVLIQAEGRDDYSPNIVECGSDSGLCLRDTRSEPANKPMMRTDHGLQVNFPSWEVIYLFRAGGNGMVFDMEGSQIGSFSWSH